MTIEISKWLFFLQFLLIAYRRNRKHLFFVFLRSYRNTRKSLSVWTSNQLWKHSPAARAPVAFLVLLQPFTWVAMFKACLVPSDFLIFYCMFPNAPMYKYWSHHSLLIVISFQFIYFLGILSWILQAACKNKIEKDVSLLSQTSHFSVRLAFTILSSYFCLIKLILLIILFILYSMLNKCLAAVLNDFHLCTKKHEIVFYACMSFQIKCVRS